MLPLPQVKKLVYVYLVRYAEEQQDLALLSISTFQRGLKVAQMSCIHQCLSNITEPVRVAIACLVIVKRFSLVCWYRRQIEQVKSRDTCTTLSKS